MIASIVDVKAQMIEMETQTDICGSVIAVTAADSDSDLDEALNVDNNSVAYFGSSKTLQKLAKG